MLKSLGYGDRVSEIEPTGTKRKQEVVLLRDWQDIVTEAEQQVGNTCKLEDLFTEEELRENSEAIRLLNREFNDLHKLDKFDVSIAALAAIVGAIIDIGLVGIPAKGPDGLEAGPLSDFIRKKFDDVFSPVETEKIVQGMYYEGFDFIHFCSQSMSVIVIELIVRVGYSIKRIKEGNKVKDSIPISMNRSKHPKLAAMLFISHTAAVNAGKVYFAKNPMTINYPQWMAFAKYSYKQLKWVVIQKPAMRDAYVEGVLNSEFKAISEETDALFEELCCRRELIMG